MWIITEQELDIKLYASDKRIVYKIENNLRKQYGKRTTERLMKKLEYTTIRKIADSSMAGCALDGIRIFF